VLSDPTAVTPTFTADRIGTYVMELVVNDGSEFSSPDEVWIEAVAADDGCLSCVTAQQELDRRARAAVMGFVFLPLLFSLARRRR
jgi:hypothetical protein